MTKTTSEKERNIQWAAGLFEGEGYCGWRKSPRTQTEQPRLFVSGRVARLASSRMGLEMTDEDSVRAFHSIAGVGTVRLRASRLTPAGNPAKPLWAWAGGTDARAFALRLLPYLGKRRASRVREVYDL